MEKLNRGDKIYLDTNKTKESEINHFLDCRDGIVEVYEYNDCSGYGSKTRMFYCSSYGSKTRMFLCKNTKHESVALIRQTYNSLSKEWIEESMHFDSNSFVYLKALLNGKEEEFGGKYSLVRDY